KNPLFVGTVREGEAQAPAWLGAIAGKGIAAQNQRQRRKVRLWRRFGKMPVAFRQGSGQSAKRQRTLLRTPAEQRARELTALTRKDQRSARFAGETIGAGPGTRCIGQMWARLTGHEVDW